ncbi:39S ribosomal protein L45, mitochondrial [Strongylocentrotus purpuratus]|uniref:Large ribosomal subunit protein mL45 n=1 Tax=Strongylocentrotus purpuratus TaxID=7668 RepID=A0A7M7RH11_STRPU|nr:39S ribosomal protein L45, mitochondrial [Strongylocentrotus purpuratus]
MANILHRSFVCCNSLVGQLRSQITHQTLLSTSIVATNQPCRNKTTQTIHKARKKARLTLKDQERMRKSEEYKNDRRKYILDTLRNAGIRPGQQYQERAITITCTGDFFEPYIPPEGDGKASSLTTEGAKQRLERVKNVGVTQMAQRKIRQFEPEFTTTDFAWKAQQIYVDAHNALQDFDRHLLHSLVTEKCYPEMIAGFRYKTIRWKMLESIEKPRIVHMRCTDMINKGNIYGQVTVRFHTRQTLAIYDRFGRIMVGSEDVLKDVLEYVVFEKHLPHRYGTWRMHGKIVPEWADHREPVVRTMVLPEEMEEEEEIEEEEGEVMEQGSSEKGHVEHQTN